MDTIPLPGKSLKGWLEFIEVTHLAAPITTDNIELILPIAMEYQCENILMSCDNVIVADEFSVRNLALSGQYKLQKSMKKLISSAAMKEIYNLKWSSDFEKIPFEVLVLIYEQIVDRKDRELKKINEQLGQQKRRVDILERSINRQ